MKYSIILILSIIFILNCNQDEPTTPQNKSPEIYSVNVFPSTITPMDSVMVVCEAYDPDGDTLVYDWLTDTRVRIKGTNDVALYHTSEKYHVFYPTSNVHMPIDTCRITCGVRDVKGGGDQETITFVVKEN